MAWNVGVGTDAIVFASLIVAENREAIRAGYVQQVQDGHVIWVKPEKESEQ